MVSSHKTWSPKDAADLREAKKLLENPGFSAKLADIIGTPIEKAFALRRL